MNETLKVGVFGARRGQALAQGAKANGMKITGLCDHYADAAKSAAQQLGCTAYTDFAEMLKSDVEAVIIANYATEHVWAVKQALAAGKHVMSECMACFTMAEAVELIEAVEQSGLVYFFAENYPFFAQNQEMRHLYESGKYGKFVYGESEYVHPISAEDMAGLYTGPDHWRSWLASTYYCTHSMGPIMLITGTRPISVNGFALPYDYDDPQQTRSLRIGDSGSVLMCRMDNEALVKILPWNSLRDHGTRTRICCNRGTMEYNQGDSRVRIHTEPFDLPNEPRNLWYDPQFPEEHRAALAHGHGGGDYFTSYYFLQAIRNGGKPLIDVYRAVDMTVIGIQGYRSALNGGAPMEIPDFHDPAMRDKYRHDDWNCDPARHREGMPSSSVRGNLTASSEALQLFQEKRAEYERKIKESIVVK